MKRTHDLLPAKNARGLLPRTILGLAIYGLAAGPLLADARALSLQVALDRAGFSPGEIDGRIGLNTRRALAAYEAVHGEIEPAREPVRSYTITEDDLEGPYIDELPDDMMEQAELGALEYTSVVEKLAERFHMSPRLLVALNRSARLRAGERIKVANVEPMSPTPEEGLARAREERTDRDVVVKVSSERSSLVVLDGGGTPLMYAPATAGSEQAPLPRGTWQVTGVKPRPTFSYDPDLFWDAPEDHAEVEVPPGPNNPVGVVWIDIDRPHYGIHGTAEPAKVGKEGSHGCVRLTNWDALRLASLVGHGTRVVFD